MEGLLIGLIAVLALVGLWVLWRIFRNLGEMGFVDPGRFRESRAESSTGALMRVRGPITAEARRIGTGWTIALRAPAMPRDLRLFRPSDSVGGPADFVVIRPGWAAEGSGRARVEGGTPLRLALEAAQGYWTLDGGVLETWVHEAHLVEARLEEGLALAALLCGGDLAPA
jgi:hypothetical protein